MFYLSRRCIECNDHVTWNVYNYSTQKFNVPLCMTHQNWINNVKSTQEVKDLYLALRLRGVPALIEYNDGFKTVDIVIHEIKVHIEVDGGQHIYNPDQAYTDLQRTYFSFVEGYITFRIPNVLIRKNLGKTIDSLIKILNNCNSANWS
jgi:very-short-patch-repair endonuclease